MHLLKNKVFLGNVLSKALAFLVFYFYAVFMDVSEYGKVVLILAVVNTIVEMSSSGLNASLMRYVAKNHRNPSYQNTILYTSILNSFVLFLIGFLLSLFFLDDISLMLFGDLKHQLEAILVVLSCIFSFLFSMFSNFLLGKEDSGKYFYLVVLLPILRVLAVLYFVFSSEVTVDKVVYISFFSVFFTVIIFLFFVVGQGGFFYSKSASANMFDYGLWMFLWAICAVVQSKFELFYLSFVLGSEALANYDVALKMLVLIMVIYTSYTALMKPKFSKCDSADEVRDVIKECKPFIFLISFMFFLSGMLVPEVFPYIGFKKYQDSFYLFQVMSFSLSFFVFSSLFNSVVFSSGNSKAFFYISLIELFIKIISLIVLVGQWGVAGAAYSYAMINIASLGLSYYFYRKCVVEWARV